MPPVACFVWSLDLTDPLSFLFLFLLGGGGAAGAGAPARRFARRLMSFLRMKNVKLD